MQLEGHKALDNALRYLSYRARSRAELQQRLGRRFPPPVVEATLARLESLRLLDDDAFARQWKENREASNPRSRALVELELKRKGVAPESIHQATTDLDDETNAYRAAQSRSRSLSNLDATIFRRRLSAHLVRRGFSFAVARKAVDQVVHEMNIAIPDDIE